MKLPRSGVKGYPRGVEPWRRNDDGSVTRGVPFEELPENIQRDLDGKPFDAAGNLRLFVRDSFYKGKYIELGSGRTMRDSLAEKAQRFGL